MHKKVQKRKKNNKDKKSAKKSALNSTPKKVETNCWKKVHIKVQKICNLLLKVPKRVPKKELKKGTSY